MARYCWGSARFGTAVTAGYANCIKNNSNVISESFKADSRSKSKPATLHSIADRAELVKRYSIGECSAGNGKFRT